MKYILIYFEPQLWTKALVNTEMMSNCYVINCEIMRHFTHTLNWQEMKWPLVTLNKCENEVSTSLFAPGAPICFAIRIAQTVRLVNQKNQNTISELILSLSFFTCEFSNMESNVRSRPINFSKRKNQGEGFKMCDQWKPCSLRRFSRHHP
jgi:hypothetical protein